ncbi:hypothetical protein E2C01_047905 [Portunus trituberculatus]|uniref:Uncharacterized protein n=1 Tax=Portunus trituberculatus TaxID=210409 RepID=A0A5B7G8R1_PORTR|nr:hypothetical protein [Portunus trituberculatus]
MHQQPALTPHLTTKEDNKNGFPKELLSAFNNFLNFGIPIGPPPPPPLPTHPASQPSMLCLLQY